MHYSLNCLLNRLPCPLLLKRRLSATSPGVVIQKAVVEDTPVAVDPRARLRLLPAAQLQFAPIPQASNLDANHKSCNAFPTTQSVVPLKNGKKM